MGYATGLIGLAAPMAAVAAFVRYAGRAERRRHQRLKAAQEPIAPPVHAPERNSFDAWQASFSNEVSSGEAEATREPSPSSDKA